MEQSKKRDSKIFITDVAVNKVPCVKVPGFSEANNKFLQETHKNLLLKAKNENNSDEVAAIYSLYDYNVIYIKGDEHSVAFGNNIDYKRLRSNSYSKELILLHNHPATGNFSLRDIDEFLNDEYIGIMSVVTNQGEIYLLQKNDKYDYNMNRGILKNLLERFCFDEQEKIVSEFLKQCCKGGVTYVKGK